MGIYEIYALELFSGFNLNIKCNVPSVQTTLEFSDWVKLRLMSEELHLNLQKANSELQLFI